MPAKNSVKQFLGGGYYHIYNRGVEKRNIFLSDQDYRVFLHLLKYYLLPFDSDAFTHPLTRVTGFIPVRQRPINTLHDKIDLLAYCLMPNHFHLLIRQVDSNCMTQFIRKLTTTYAMYFNRQNQRVGHLFQGVYKACLISADEYLLHLSRYIHRNPIDLLTGSDPVMQNNQITQYPYSSYQYYLGSKSSGWLKTKTILNYYDSDHNQDLLREMESYRHFVESPLIESGNLVGRLTLE